MVEYICSVYHAFLRSAQVGVLGGILYVLGFEASQPVQE